MALREDILQPVAGDAPAGENLRYAPVYDKIKEARRQDDDAAQGDWQRERKVADYPTVIRLASEAIATKSKDLQLAAWLTEALLFTDGYSGLRDGLELIRALVEQFWDGLWPELEDGDPEMRAAPIDWVGRYLAIPTKRIAITRSGYDYLKYQEARAVGYEPEDYDKKARWQETVNEGKLPLEQFDKALAATPREFYEEAIASIDGCVQVMEDSQPLFEEKFGDFTPSYGRLREAIDEVRRTLRGFLQKKKEAEPAAPEPETPVVADEPAAHQWDTEPVSAEPQQTSVQAVAPARAARRITSIEPADKEDATERVAAAAAFWRREDAYSPAPYLMLRGMRWGELRASGSLDASILEAPPTEVRTALKRLLSEGSYAELLEVAETAMAGPCGRAWLDLQRYVATACDSLGYTAISSAICSEVKALVRDYPDLIHATLLDDTATANKETQAWIAQFAAPEESTPAVPAWPDPVRVAEPEVDTPSGDIAVEEAPDTFELAMDAVRGGRTEEAVGILADEAARQTSGRGRFQRKLQLAQVCLATGNDNIAHSVLEELAEAIERHRLEEWESADLVAHALSMLYSCAERTEGDPAARNLLYARICRLSPVQALRHGTQARAHRR